MKTQHKNSTASSDGIPQNRCLSCGTTENMRRRKYCSIECRQQLRHSLNLRTGLLRALNTRYATFYFTEAIIVLDVLPYGSGELFSYILPRSTNAKPVDDFCTLSNILGNAWWAERNRTNKRYLANRFILEKAKSKDADSVPIKQVEVKQPAKLKKSLMFLKLQKSDLNSPGLERKIKSAYRKQAMQHHPDLGGDAAGFRKLHDAYEQMIRWSENPIFIRRRGFPDKWFYDGSMVKWVQPAPGLTNSS